MQNLCHLLPMLRLAGLLILSIALDTSWAQVPAAAAPANTGPAHDYPTVARVEYVTECMGKSGGKLAALYQCSCAIDKIADALSYDDFVEASTFARYATLPGEGGGIFRDSEHARQTAKSFRDLEANALKACGMIH